MNMEIISVSRNGEDPFLIDEPERPDDVDFDDQPIVELTTQIQQMSVGDEKENEEMEIEVDNICAQVQDMCLTHTQSQKESKSSNGKMEVEKKTTPEGMYFVGIFFSKFLSCVVLIRFSVFFYEMNTRLIYFLCMRCS